MSREGSLDAPTRHPLAWRDDDFYDAEKIDAEMRRVFDICHGCRRCFNLCNSFPRLFTLIDDGPTEELDGVKSEDFPKVVEACTLCDMCFMTKCPYVPPHPFNLDFPHLMLRYRAAEVRAGKTDFTARQLAEMDRNGRLARTHRTTCQSRDAPQTPLTRPLMEATLGIDACGAAEIPYQDIRDGRSRRSDRANEAAPAYAAKEGRDLRHLLCELQQAGDGTRGPRRANHIGVETEVAYPGCCGMPFLEQAELDRVAENAAKVSKALVGLVDEGYDIVTPTASCGLMLKFEWPLIVPENEDVQRLARATYDIDEYVVMIAKQDGLPAGLTPLPEGVTVHLACHARAQNMGPKAAEMLRLIPETRRRDRALFRPWRDFRHHEGDVSVAMKVGKPAMRSGGRPGARAMSPPIARSPASILCRVRARWPSDGKVLPVREAEHPIEIFARAYGLLD